jgi:hypothetical protein
LGKRRSLKAPDGVDAEVVRGKVADPAGLAAVAAMMLS